MQRSEAVPETRRLDIALLVAAFLAVLANACLFLYAALSRLTFPLELEANEDTVADCALQVLRGGGLYGEPTFEFIPTLYGPVHPYLLALFMRMLGTEFWVGRLLSVLASVVAAGFLGGIIARYAGRLWGFLFSLLMLGLYAPTGFWMDLVRVDALHMALTVSAVWCLDDRPGRARIFAGGLLLTASAFTKATTAPLVLLLPISVMLREKRWSWNAVLPTWGLSATLFILMNVMTEGRFWQYQFVFPSRNVFVWGSASELLLDWGIRLHPILLLGATYAYITRVRRASDLLRDPLMLAAAVMLPTAVLAAIKDGGWVNSYLPALALLLGTAGAAVTTLLRSGIHGRRIACLAILTQSILWSFNPARMIPTRREHREAQRILTRAAEFRRPWFVENGFTIAARGGPMAIDMHHLIDFLRGRPPSVSLDQIIRSFNEARIDAILITKRPGDSGLASAFLADYVLDSTIELHALRDMGRGWQSDRLYIYVPRSGTGVP